MKQVSRIRQDRTVIGASLLGTLVAVALFVSTPAQGAEVTAWPNAAGNGKLKPVADVDVTVIPQLDLATVQREDEVGFKIGLPPRFAVAKPVHITPDNAGTWEPLDRQNSIWRLRVESPKAKHINLGFTRYVMPQGGQLFIYSQDFHDIIRGFTAADNASHEQLWTPPVDGEKMMIELTIPNAVRNQLQLELGSINIGFRPFGDKGDEEGGIASGSCNVDVVCPEGVPWAAEIPSVANLSQSGSFFCTGYLVNNTAQDRKPYLMTANHCGVTSGNAASLVCYWNYQNSTCRPVGSAASGGAGNGSLGTFSSGSTWRAGSSTASDFTLVELSSQPNVAWNLSWAGWDRSGAQSVGGATIHHPNNNEKRITFYTASTDTNACGFSGIHVRAFWTLGVTEPGSSGCPLFDSAHHVIGQLHGGPSACGASQLWDCYGRFSSSWTGGGTSTTRLSNWLDPLGTAPNSLNTIQQSPPGPANDLCANATIVGAGAVAFTTVNATTDGLTEPACNFSGYSQVGNDVWYRYAALCTGTATISLCGASYNAKLAVYGSACPTVSGTQLACNDDFCGSSPQVSFPVVSGTVYRVRIGGFNGATGTGTMVITCTPSAPPCPADIALPHNGFVNTDDLLVVINSWGPCAGCAADIAQPPNGFVNTDDLLVAINAWGACP